MQVTIEGATVGKVDRKGTKRDGTSFHVRTLWVSPSSDSDPLRIGVPDDLPAEVYTAFAAASYLGACVVVLDLYVSNGVQGARLISIRAAGK